jgi:hypothetical protein
MRRSRINPLPHLFHSLEPNYFIARSV